MIPLAAGQLGLCDATTESSRLEPVLHGKRNRLNEKLEHHNKEQPPHPTSPTTPPPQPQLMQLEKDCPDNSAGKESACNAGDTGLIPGSGRSPGEGIGYPLQYSWISLVAQLVKNPPATGNLGSIPGLGRSPGEGKGYPL